MNRLRLNDFTGGLNTKSPPSVIKQNQALYLSNLNIFSYGGFEKRYGNSEFNSSAMNSGANVQGLGYFRTALGTDYLMVICGAKIFKSDNLDGTMDDITGAVTITAGQNNLWTHTQMNNLSIFVGGSYSAPDAPIKYNGAGNAAALGGTPPSGLFCFSANNRAFIGSTAANRSRLYWSIVGNPEDWSGTGSGNQDIHKDDGDDLIGGVPIGLDTVLLFKQNSIYAMSIQASPFPVFPLFFKEGAVSRHGIVSVGDLTYFITPEPRMKATNGSQIFDFPSDIDDIWDGLEKDRLQYIQGIYYKRLNQILWMCSSDGATTNDICIIWDVARKCWLYHPTGFGMNAAVVASDRKLYTGGYNGKIYLQDDSSTYDDASESATPVSAEWRSGWMDISDFTSRKIPLYVEVNARTQESGTFEFSYGFDFSEDIRTEIISQTEQSGAVFGSAVYGVFRFGGVTDFTKMVLLKGSGKFIQFYIKNNNAGEALAINGISVSLVVAEDLALK